MFRLIFGLALLVIFVVLVSMAANEFTLDIRSKRMAIDLIANSSDPEVKRLANTAMLDGLNGDQVVVARAKVIEIVSALPVDVRSRVFAGLKKRGKDGDNKYLASLLGA